MAIRSGFFNSVNGDRRYLANNFAEYFSTFIGNGVFPDPAIGLQVQAKLNMTITVKPGKGWINGYYLINDGDFDLTISNADGVLNRIDRVVMRWDINTRNIVVQLKKGAFASSPVAPALQRDQEIFELALADIYVAKGITSISQSAITDKRLEKSVCGIVSGVVDQIDTTNLFTQYNVSFNEWFDTVKDYLNDTAVGNVANKLAEHTMDGTSHGIGDKSLLQTSHKNTIVDAINEVADYSRTPGYAVANGTNSYTVSLNPAPTSYKEGMGLVVKVINASTGAATININGLGSKSILKTNGIPVSNLKKGAVYTLRYSGVNFFLQGEGSEDEKILIDNNWKLFLKNLRLTYVDELFYYGVNQTTDEAYKILRSNMTIVNSLKKVTQDSRWKTKTYTPNRKTEIYSGSAPTQNSNVYDDNNSLKFTFDNGWYNSFITCSDDRIYKFYSGTSYYPWVELFECNLNGTLIKIMLREENVGYQNDGAFILSGDRGRLSMGQNSIYEFTSLKNNIYTKIGQTNNFQNLMSNMLAMTMQVED